MPTLQSDSPARWDMSNIFSGLDGQDYRDAFAQLAADLQELQQFFDTNNIRGGAPSAAGETDELAETLAAALDRTNAYDRQTRLLDAFVYAFFTTDSYDSTAQRETSKLELLDTRRRKLGVRLEAWIGALAPRLEELGARNKTLQDHAFFLRHSAEQSRYLMSEELEGLAAELCVDGGGAFGKLQGNVTSQLKASFERDGKTENLPITVIRNLSLDPDPEVRRRAYATEQQAWRCVQTPVAASLNSVKGTAITLARRRGRASVLEEALEQNRIDRPTLDAMLGAIREAFPVFRGYLRSKAEKLGQKQLAWWDLMAPMGSTDRRYRWSEARGFIVEKFATFTPELGEFAARAFDNRWIDGEPRDGKRGGAFCMAVEAVEESRILANFDGSFDQVSTLAHELGHGYHNHCQRGLPALRRGAPSTLAETASIFCETLIAESALHDAAPAEQLMILETQLSGATQVCLDISSRFLFEQAFIERREQSELSPEEICVLMLAAQAETYGDGLQPETYHRYMWLWKPHYYVYKENFYNFPYAFGHLFGLGLYAIWRKEGEAFVPRYQQLLRDTAQDYAAPLAARFGLDITGAEFWRNSLRVIQDQAERFAALEP